jgi:serine protease Do
MLSGLAITPVWVSTPAQANDRPAAIAEATTAGATATDTPPTDAAAGQLAVAMGFSQAFERVAADVSPSVVNITATYGSAQRGRNPQQEQMDEFMRRFFGGPGGGPGGGLGIPQQRRGQSYGSGFIVSTDGYILTNHHVIEGQPDKVEVRLFDDTTYEAKVVGGDPATDVAVLKIEVQDLKPARLGETSTVRPGQWVLAIGSPFNLAQTVTAGIVSSVSRGGVAPGLPSSQGGEARYDNFIQTDAAINPGNSGGPLVNLRGEVIGINSAIFSRSGGSVGIGFAIPINLARNIKESLIATGVAERGGFLGVGIQGMTTALAKQLNFTGTDGVLVTEVNEDSPAAKSGLQVEDIITSIDGLKTHDPDSLRTIVRRLPPGKEVPVAIVRAGQPKTVSVTLGQTTPEQARASAPADVTNKLGVAVQDVSTQVAQRFRLRGGVEITAVGDESILAQYVQVGDVIVQIGQTAIPNTETFAQALEQIDLTRGVRVRVVGRAGVRIIGVQR